MALLQHTNYRVTTGALYTVTVRLVRGLLWGHDRVNMMASFPEHGHQVMQEGHVKKSAIRREMARCKTNLLRTIGSCAAALARIL